MTAFRGSVVSSGAAYSRSLTAPVITRLGRLGIDGTANPLAAVVYAQQVTATRVREVASWPEVERVHRQGRNPQNQLANAVPSIYGDIVRGRGISGVSAQIGVIDAADPYVPSHPNIAASSLLNNPGVEPCVPGSPHEIEVVGTLLANSYGGNANLGVAQGATVWVDGACNATTASPLEIASGNAIANNSNLLNESWGFFSMNAPYISSGTTYFSLDASDQVFDGYPINYYVATFVSAGNYGSDGTCCFGASCTGEILSPGKGYNVITVGGFSETGLPWSPNNKMFGCSSSGLIHSVHADRVKPEIAAPATDPNTLGINTTGFGGRFVNISGTSFAAPLAAGTAALAIQRDGSWRSPPVSILQVWPEAIKAILMATATDDITNGGQPGDPRLSLEDGAGGIVADQVDIVVGSTPQWGSVDFSSYADCAAIPSSTLLGTIYLSSGKAARIAMAWDTVPSDSTYFSSPEPSTDFDLYVYDPHGLLWAISSSSDNVYEIVEGTPTINGNYSVYASKYACNTTSNPKWMGWAWIQNFRTR